MFAYISFCGFYYSILDIDREIESHFECLSYDESEEKMDFIRDNTEFDYSEIRERVATKYVELYTDELNDMLLDCDLPEVFLEFAGIDSPREYNFSNDALKVHISPIDLRTIRKLAECLRRNNDGEQDENGYSFSEYVNKRMCPRDGFIPYYSQDVRDWGAVKDWGLAQLEVLFDFVLPHSVMCDENLYLYDLVECLNEAVFECASCPEYIEGKE